MATYGIIARNYAKALFAVVTESSTAEASTTGASADFAAKENLASSLLALGEALASETALRAFFDDPRTQSTKKAEVFSGLIDTLPALSSSPFKSHLKNFLSVVATEKRESYLKEIAEAFKSYVEQEAKLRALDITTAKALSSNEQETFKQDVSRTLGSNISIQWQVDADLIGGMLVQSGDLVLDGSLRGSLDRAKAALLSEK